MQCGRSIVWTGLALPHTERHIVHSSGKHLVLNSFILISNSGLIDQYFSDPRNANFISANNGTSRSLKLLIPTSCFLVVQEPRQKINISE